MSRFHFKSKSTKYSVISTTHDGPGQVVRTAGGDFPPFSVRGPHWQIFSSAYFSAHNYFFLAQILHVKDDGPGVVTITGLNGLYVSLNNVSQLLYFFPRVLTKIVFRKVTRALSSLGPLRNTPGKSKRPQRGPASK